MRLLLDTHIFIWVAEGNKRLSKHARDAIQQAEIAYVSSVSIVEAAIKANQGNSESMSPCLQHELAKTVISICL